MIQAQEVRIAFEGRSWLKRTRNEVLKGFSMTAPSGAATGLIGANGSGKTTFFRACAGLCPLQGGRILIDGVDPAVEPERARALLGVLPERPGIPAGWTGRDALDAACALKGLFSASARAAMEREIDRWALEAFMERPASGYSRGQLVRVALAREALRPAPNVILDEPTAGLDFQSASTVRSWARELRADGACLLISTHIVAEIDALCQEVAGLRDGVAWSAQDTRAWVADAGSELRMESGDGP